MYYRFASRDRRVVVVIHNFTEVAMEVDCGDCGNKEPTNDLKVVLAVVVA
jgi:hypothetical protein